jgi:hypothetical protein
MQKKLSILLFTFILIGLPVLSALLPCNTYSEKENRTLASFPHLNFDAILSKQFMSGFDSFVSDHFAFRDWWVSAKAGVSTAIGKRDNQRTGETRVYLGNGCLIDDIRKPNGGIFEANIKAINTFAKKSGKPAFFLLAPTSAEVERDKLPAYATTFDQKAFISTVKGKLKNVRIIDAVDTLKRHKDEYVYYRTDHHWTTLGAYYAYAASGEALGFSPLALDSFNVTHATNSFFGTLSSKSGYHDLAADTIDLYKPKTGSSLKTLTIGTGTDARACDSIYFNGWLQKVDKYSVFFNSNQGYEDLTTTSPGKRLLLIKDSYARCYIPFLMSHYSRITMIDPRYLTKPLGDLVNTDDYDQILFLYDVDTFNTSKELTAIN